MFQERIGCLQKRSFAARELTAITRFFDFAYCQSAACLYSLEQMNLLMPVLPRR